MYLYDLLSSLIPAHSFRDFNLKFTTDYSFAQITTLEPMNFSCNEKITFQFLARLNPEHYCYRIKSRDHQRVQSLEINKITSSPS